MLQLELDKLQLLCQGTEEVFAIASEVVELLASPDPHLLWGWGDYGQQGSGCCCVVSS